MENKDRKNTQPEFTPDYIDRLFSGTDSKPQPPEPVVAPPAAEEQPQPPRKKKPSKLRRKLRRHKKVLAYLAAAAVLILMVYLVIPNTIANAQSDRWQTRCEETYVELISRKAYHYTRKINSGSNAKNAEFWQHGSNQLTIYDRASGQKYIELFVNQIRYTKLIEADGSSFKWKHKADYSGVMDTNPKTLAEGKYILKSIRSSLSGTDVTFRHEKYGNQKLTFHFGAFGTFVGLTAESDIEGEPWIWVYTILPTAEDEILDTILKYHEDATQ